jgi:hypothetical protein
MVQILVGIVKGEGAQNRFSAASARPAAVTRASKPAAPRAPAKAAKVTGKDWSGVASAKASHGNGHANGHARKAALASARTVNPDQVIPMDDSDLKDF